MIVCSRALSVCAPSATKWKETCSMRKLYVTLIDARTTVSNHSVCVSVSATTKFISIACVCFDPLLETVATIRYFRLGIEINEGKVSINFNVNIVLKMTEIQRREYLLNRIQYIYIINKLRNGSCVKYSIGDGARAAYTPQAHTQAFIWIHYGKQCITQPSGTRQLSQKIKTMEFSKMFEFH